MGIETAIAIAGLAATAATVGTSIYSATQKPDTPKPPVIAPVDINKNLSETDEKVRRQAMAANGKSSTILTDPLGENDSQSHAPTLLGG